MVENELRTAGSGRFRRAVSGRFVSSFLHQLFGIETTLSSRWCHLCGKGTLQPRNPPKSFPQARGEKEEREGLSFQKRDRPKLFFSDLRRSERCFTALRLSGQPRLLHNSEASPGALRPMGRDFTTRLCSQRSAASLTGSLSPVFMA